MEQMEAEVVEFVVPVENSKTLFVWNLEASQPEHVLLASLSSLFSSLGLCTSSNLSPTSPGFLSALVKFFHLVTRPELRERPTGKALLQMPSHSLLQDRPLKVRLSSKKMPHFLSHSTPLSHAHCLNLANHLLGFNGWTSHIITLKELDPDLDPDQSQDSGVVTLRLGCLLQLHFPFHQITTRGATVLQDTFTCSDPVEMLRCRGRLQRAVREKALVQAFSNVLLVLIGNGKVVVDLKGASSV
ncbi:LOW QUALITY PROTEIN: RAD52 motif-containing protein 1 [Periophthalmus magnuspinnatus]|uniref:LOW QUALITY PROTEIN: RAD52 motif-containing protein 1 n=1 Tax=Periophthalmus magnuspinnatus TaxID=409849 RepID=UPI002436D0B9|nr:LOW QUALITY PROTEIN: RAD52 motif-containing protein 1 [Periophthalmus magnuspinnatus]